MALIGKAAIELSANTARFTSDMGRATRYFQRSSQQMQKSGARIESSLANIARAGRVAAGAILAIGFRKIIGDNVAAGDAIQKLGLRLGESAEALTEFKFIAEQAGIGFDSFGTSLQRQQRRIAQAAEGSGEAVKALQELGVSAKQLSTLSVTEQFLALARAFRNIEEDGKRTTLAFKLWDAEGVKNLQIVNQGTEAIRKQAIQARELGLVLSQDNADALAKISDAWGTLTQRMSISAQEFIAMTFKWLPAFVDKVNGARKALEQFLESFKPAETRTTLRGLGAGIIDLSNQIQDLVVQINQLKRIRENLDAFGNLSMAQQISRDRIPEQIREREKALEGLKKQLKEVQKLYREQQEDFGSGLTIKVTKPGGVLGNGGQAQTQVEKLPEQIELVREHVKSLNRDSDRLERTWDDLGFAFESAFENAIINGEKLRDVLKGLAQDIARLVLRKTVTNPLAAAVTSAVGGLFSSAAASPGVLGQNVGQYLTRPAPSIASGVSSQFGQAQTGVNVNVVQNLQSLDPSNAATVVRGGMLANTDVIQSAYAESVRRGGIYRQVVK